MSSYVNSPDLFKIPSPSTTPMMRKIGGLEDASPEFPALDPATRDLIARTSKLLGATHRDTDSPVLSAIPDSPFSTPLIKAATSRTRYGLPSVSRVVAASASKNKAAAMKMINEELSQSPDFNLEAPAPAPSYVSTTFLQNLKQSNASTAPMRDSTNTAAATGQGVTSVQNLVSLILGKKSGSANEATAAPAAASSTRNFLSEIPSPPKLSSTFDQENEWENNQTMDRDRSPEIERTIRVRSSLGRHDAAGGAEQTSLVQMPSPMKYGDDESFEETAGADQFDQTISEAVESTTAQPTMTFKLSRATLPDDYDDVNESIAERTITKLNPKWLPPPPATAGSRPQLIQIPSILKSNTQQQQQPQSQQHISSLPTTENVGEQSDDAAVEPESAIVQKEEDNHTGAEEDAPVDSTTLEENFVNFSHDSRSSITEDTEPSHDSDQSRSEDEKKESDYEEELAAKDAEIACQTVNAILLRRQMPLQDAITFVMNLTLPSMPENFKSVAAIFSASQLKTVVGNVSEEDIVAACRHLMRRTCIEQLTFPENPMPFWRAIIPPAQ